VRCTRCGNENPATNRYCGMCGATLLPTTGQAGPPAKPPATAPAAGTAAGAAVPPGEVRARTAAQAQGAASGEAPVISGPSFLGLNQPPSSSQRSNPLSIDPHAAPSSRSLDYLLEDDEQPKGRAAKFVLIVVALALAAGFGYLRWRNQALPWLGSHAAKPSATAPSPEGGDSSSTAPSSSTAVPGGTSPSTPTPAPGAADSTAGVPSSASPASGTPSPGTSAANPASNTAQPIATASAGSGSSSAATGSTSAVNSPTSPAPEAAAAPPRKPRVTPAPVDPVSEAQKYIYGKGVRQDCDRGLRLLKPAADQANSKAMIEMGALYSAGLCTPRDLPTSYRWFALALRKDPNNQSLQADLQKLWGEMTQPERQLAIRLSQ
jgi:hypothetical protein